MPFPAASNPFGLAVVPGDCKASVVAVRGGYGRGDVLTAERAVAAGLADRVETLAEAVRRLGGTAR